MTDDPFTRELLESIERASKLLAAYKDTPRRAIRQALLAEYYCPSPQRSHPLLTVWQSPEHGPLVLLRPYVKSHALNAAESNAAGRQANASDGDNHWNGQILLLRELVDLAELSFKNHDLPLRCANFRGSLPLSELLTDVDAATPGAPTKRRMPRSPR